MKVTPLFRTGESSNPIRDEEFLRLLDEPNDSPTRRAFLNQCALSSEDMDRWNRFNQAVNLGKKLPVQEPDPAIRTHVIEAAYEAIQGRRSESISKEIKPLSNWFPGWRWAWVTLFVGILYCTYDQFSTNPVMYTTSDYLDYELLSLEEDLNLLQEDIDWFSNLGTEEQA